MLRRFRTQIAAAALLIGSVVLQPAGAAQPIYPIIDGDTGYVLGGSQGGTWVGPMRSAATIHAGDRYRLFTRAGLLGRTTVSAAASAGAPCDSTRVVKLAPKPAAGNALAVSGPWNPQPRRIVALKNKSTFYRKIVADILRAHGIAKPDVRVTRVLRVDLDGDGVTEVIISATRQPSPVPRIAAGDYSLVVIRKIVAGKAVIIPVAGEYYTKAAAFAAPNTYTIVAPLDLNGDGRMEVVVDSQYYEGAATAVYQVGRSSVVKQLVTGCGA